MVQEDTVRFVSPGVGRDTISIVHGCVWTLILCSWSSVHLNVPAEHDTEWKVTLRKARWMLISIIAPEYVAIHAIRDWYETRWLLKQIHSVMARRQSSPTLEQSAKPSIASIEKPPLARLPSRDKTYQNNIIEEIPGTLTKEHLNKLQQAHLRKTSNTSTLKDFTDEKSERTTSYGGLTLVSSEIQPLSQISIPAPKWKAEHAYYVQMGGFDLRFEDMTTFRPNAFQFLALLKHNLINLPDISAKEINDQSKSDVFAKTWACVQMFWLISYLITRATEHLPVTTLELFTAGEVCCTLMMYIGWWKKPKDVSTSCKLYMDMKWDDIRGLVESEEIEGRHDCTRIPMSDHLARRKTGMKHFTFIIALPTFVFGTCHLLGWHQYFPSYVEKMLWRVSSVACLVLPLAIVALGEMTRRQPQLTKCNYGTCVLILLYTVFRMYMCAEMFAGLRQVPTGVYEDKQWTRYIPHVGS